MFKNMRLNMRQNIDDTGYLKWGLARYLHPGDHNPARITKIDKELAKELNFKVSFLSKLNIVKKVVSALLFLVMKIWKNIQTVYQKLLLKDFLTYYW